MKILRTAALLGSLVPLSMAVQPSEAASVTYDWSITGPAASLGGLVWTGSGTLTVTPGTGSDVITGITGTLTNGTATDPITGLATPGSFDNLLFPVGITFSGPPVTSGTYVSASDLDTKGLGFTIAAGTIDIFSFFAPNSTNVTVGNNFGESAPGGFGVGTFAITATPLPAALPMFAGGLGLVGMMARRKKRKTAIA